MDIDGHANGPLWQRVKTELWWRPGSVSKPGPRSNFVHGPRRAPPLCSPSLSIAMDPVPAHHAISVVTA